MLVRHVLYQLSYAPVSSLEVYLADDFVSIAEEPGFVNDFFQKILKRGKREKNARNEVKISIKLS